MLKGADKWNPMPIPGLPEGYAIQEDNVTVEYNVPVCGTRDDWNDAIIVGLTGCFNQGLIDPKEYTFSRLAAHVFPDDKMTHPGSQVFGCEPDYNAWTGKVNKKIKLPEKLKNLRTAGGHVHIETDLPPYDVVKALDLVLGVPSILLCSPSAAVRRKMYGKSGACRVKKYGVEYRVLDNFWIFDQSSRDWIWDGVERALQMIQDNSIDFASLGGVIQSTINSEDIPLAQTLVNTFDLHIPTSNYGSF
jgi:hypothetical protein